MILKLAKDEEEMIKMVKLLCKMEEDGMKDLDEIIRKEMEGIKTKMGDKTFDRQEDMLSYVWGMLKPTLSPYLPSWFS